MNRTLAQVQDLSPFEFTAALCLFPTTEPACGGHNISKLHACGQPIAILSKLCTQDQIHQSLRLPSIFRGIAFQDDS